MKAEMTSSGRSLSLPATIPSTSSTLGNGDTMHVVLHAVHGSVAPIIDFRLREPRPQSDSMDELKRRSVSPHRLRRAWIIRCISWVLHGGLGRTATLISIWSKASVPECRGSGDRKLTSGLRLWCYWSSCARRRLRSIRGIRGRDVVA